MLETAVRVDRIQVFIGDDYREISMLFSPPCLPFLPLHRPQKILPLPYNLVPLYGPPHTRRSHKLSLRPSFTGASPSNAPLPKNTRLEAGTYSFPLFTFTRVCSACSTNRDTFGEILEIETSLTSTFKVQYLYSSDYGTASISSPGFLFRTLNVFPRATI
jgi:hypothetical protein